MKEIFDLNIINREVELPIQEEFYKMVNQPRDDLQERAIDYLCGEGSHKVLSLNTNAGKTYISINAISRIKSNTIILVDTIALGQQWREEFIKHTNLEDVQLIDASDIENDNVEDANVFIVTEQSINSLMLRDYHKLEEFIHEKQIGIKIFDESHTRFHDLTRINNIFNTAQTIYLTATFDRKYTEIKQWKEIFSGVEKMIEKTEERYRKIYLVRYKSGPNPSEWDINYVVGMRGPSSMLWGKYILKKEDRLRRPLLYPAVRDIIRKLQIKPRIRKSVCIIVPLNEMIKRLKIQLEMHGYKVGVYTSAEAKKRSTNEIFANQIVLTNSSMFSKGIDIPNLKWLINFTSVTNLSSLEQVVGRLRGKESDEEEKVYIDCVDIAFGDSFVKQQKVRRRYYKKITTDLELLKEKNVIKLYE